MAKAPRPQNQNQIRSSATRRSGEVSLTGRDSKIHNSLAENNSRALVMMVAPVMEAPAPAPAPFSGVVRRKRGGGKLAAMPVLPLFTGTDDRLFTSFPQRDRFPLTRGGDKGWPSSSALGRFSGEWLVGSESSERVLKMTAVMALVALVFPGMEVFFVPHSAPLMEATPLLLPPTIARFTGDRSNPLSSSKHHEHVKWPGWPRNSLWGIGRERAATRSTACVRA